MPTKLPYAAGDLSEVLQQIWALLARGQEDPDSPLNSPVLATVARDGEPDARTVVLRRVEPERRRLYVNTDARSPKRRELSPLPRAMFVFYDPRGRTQLRIRAHVQIHHQDEVTRRAWDELAGENRRLYMTTSPPGDLSPIPTSGLPPRLEEHGAAAGDEEVGYRHFAVLEAIATHIDWLYFTESSPRRAAFSWETDGGLRASWLYP